MKLEKPTKTNQKKQMKNELIMHQIFFSDKEIKSLKRLIESCYDLLKNENEIENEIETIYLKLTKTNKNKTNDRTIKS